MGFQLSKHRGLLVLKHPACSSLLTPKRSLFFSSKRSDFNCCLFPTFPTIFKSQKFPQTTLNRHMFHQNIPPSNLITSTLLIELYNISNYLNSFCFVLFGETKQNLATKLFSTFESSLLFSVETCLTSLIFWGVNYGENFGEKVLVLNRGRR